MASTRMRRVASTLVAVMMASGALAMTVAPARAAAGDGVLTGRITQPGGAPLAGAYVQLYADTGGGQYVAVTDTDTDASGRYDVQAPPGTTYHVRVGDGCNYYEGVVIGSPDNNVSTGSNVTLSAGADTELNVQLTTLRPTSPNDLPCLRVEPELTGRPQVGVPMRVSPGVWAQPGVVVTYQWYVDNNTPIVGQTSPSYTPTAQDVGRHVYVQVVATLGNSVNSRYGDPMTNVRRGDLVFSTGPRVLGAPAVGAVLTASLGTLAPSASVSLQWRRNGVPIAGATGRSYKVTSADRGRTVSAAIVYRTFGYTTISRVVSTPFTVRSLARMSVSAKRGTRRATFTVRVSPKASKKSKGVVIVREGATKVKGVSIRSGKATFTVTHLKKGKHVYTVTYQGKKYAAQKTVTVRVR